MAVCDCEENGFFFQQAITTICNNFPLLFERGDEGDGEGERDNNAFGQNKFASFGIIPYILKYCEVTNETLTTVMKESVRLVFYIVSFEVVKAKEQDRQLKEIRNKNKR